MVALSFNAAADTEVELCSPLSNLAEKIMKSRQIGVPMREVMEIKSLEDASEKWTTLYREIVTAAYKTPKYSTTEVQNETITEYGNKIMTQCLSALE